MKVISLAAIIAMTMSAATAGELPPPLEQPPPDQSTSVPVPASDAAAPEIATAQPRTAIGLSEIMTIQLVYRSEAEVEGCESSIRAAIEKAGLSISDNAAVADAVYKIKLLPSAAGMRKRLEWGVALEAPSGTRYFLDHGLESGWSHAHACRDLAPDLAAYLIGQIRTARAVNF